MDAVDANEVNDDARQYPRPLRRACRAGEALGPIVDHANAVAANVQAFSKHLPALGEKADALVAALDPEKVNRALDNIDRFTTMLGENSDDIHQIVANARNCPSASTRSASARIAAHQARQHGRQASRRDHAGRDRYARRDPRCRRQFQRADHAARQRRHDFCDRGLRDLQNLIGEGQRTLGRLNRVISNLEQNPTGFLLGGEVCRNIAGGGARAMAESACGVVEAGGWAGAARPLRLAPLVVAGALGLHQPCSPARRTRSSI